jgi:protein-tyrosine phosphatase
VIDLHCHLLPGVDDGPASVEESVALARALAAQGVSTVAATPHVRADHPLVVPAELDARRVRLAERLAAERIGLEVVGGGEVDLLWARRASVAELRLVSFAQRGTDLLVETPYGPLPAAFEDVLLEIGARGFRLLLAHPERNPTFQRDPARLRRLIDLGTLVQVTAASLARDPARSRSAALATRLVKDRLAHVIASDAHRAEGSLSPRLAQGVAAAAAIDPAVAGWMSTGAPARILTGQPLDGAPT